MQGNEDDNSFMENFTTTLAAVADGSLDRPCTSKASQRPRKRFLPEKSGKKFPNMPEMVIPLHSATELIDESPYNLPNPKENSPSTTNEERQNFLNHKLLMLQKEERALQTFLMHLRNQQSTLTVEKMRLKAEIEQQKKNPNSLNEINAIERDILKGFRSEGVDSGEEIDEDDEEENLTDEELSDEDEEYEKSLEDPNQEQDLDSDIDEDPIFKSNIKMEF